MGTVLTVLLLASCLRTPSRPVPHHGRDDALQEIRGFRRDWLEDAHLAPPTVEFEPVVIEDGPYVASAEPLLAEDATWNHWGDGSCRLFNDRAAWWFSVRVDGAPFTWDPSATELRVNGVPTSPPATAPDDFLVPLFRAALLQENFGLAGDLVDRTRAAGPFRSAYFVRSVVFDQAEGIIGFPKEDAELQATHLELWVSIRSQADDSRHTFHWAFN